LNHKENIEGVIIRPLHAFDVHDGMRVTVGFEEDNDFFIEKLKKVL
jgi:histidinol-phosphate/aromatic aminotransferase/cobyric acid decarboxylase-like protein